MLQKSVYSIAAGSLAVALLSGCGADVTSIPAPANQIGGNWLLAGALPQLTAPGFSYAVTLDIRGDEISPSPSFSFYCDNPNPVNAGSLQPATIGRDGSFVTESPDYPGTPPTLGLMLQGTAPTSAQTAWPGSFGFSNIPSGCDLPAAGNFTATPIAQVTGTYGGTFSVSTGSSDAPLPLTVQADLQQGGTLSGSTVYSDTVINGTIAVQGSSCVSSGTTSSSSTQGYIGGDVFLLDFVMDDGSTWQMLGFMENTGSTKLLLEGIQISGGSCGYQSVEPNVELTLQ